MTYTIQAGWGSWTDEALSEYMTAIIRDFDRCIEVSEPSSLEALLALHLKARELGQFLFDPDSTRGTARQQTLMALAERLTSFHSAGSHAASFLVRGFQIGGDLIGPWTAEFPEYEVDPGCVMGGVRRLTFNLPSSFRLLVDLSDYRGAWELCERHPGAFISPRLRGFRCVVEGMIYPELSHELFAKAADAFEEDTHDRARQVSESYSSINCDLWAPFFRSRSLLAQAVRRPEDADSLVSAAAAIAPSFIGWNNRVVHRYHFLVRAVAGILDLKNGLNPEEARAEFERDNRMFGSGNVAPVVLEFLEHAVAGFDKLQKDRRRGLTAVGRAMAALDRLPFMQGLEAEGIRVIFDQRTLELIEGPNRTWIYRTLESIKDERKLQRILLRLFQNGVPRFAQIRHGPIEYGKDIVVVAIEGIEAVLRMYQVKCGNIAGPQWNKIRPQVEQIFQVSFTSFQLPCEIQRQVGILVWNGHVDAHVEPVMHGWAKDQAKIGRNYEFMNLDSLVTYVFDYRLTSALRDALKEEGVPII